MCFFLDPTSLKLSELPELPGRLFPFPDWESFSSLFVQISFQFLGLPLLFWHPYDSDVGTFKDVLEVPKPLLIFLNSCFFILFWLNVYFFLLVQIIDLSPSFLAFSVGLLYILLYYTLLFTFFSILRPYPTISVSTLITSVLNPASDRLAICSLLSSIFGA